MKINKLNYENYVIDYIEGTLSVELKKDFDLFLDKNKDVYDEIKDYMSAPILEEPEVVYADKKTILRKNYTGRYALLALIPFLLVGAYFLIGNGEENKTEDLKTKDVQTQFVQTNLSAGQTQEQEVQDIPKQQADVVIEKDESKDQETKKVIEVKKVQKKATQVVPVLKKEDFDIKKVEEPSQTEMNFASIETPIEAIEMDEAPRKDLISNPIQLGNMKMNFDFDTRTIPNTDMAFAEVKSFDGSQENGIREQIKKNSSWLEMFTPASFEDIDLKESLAIQTNDEVNSTRKILNAFIPERLVK